MQPVHEWVGVGVFGQWVKIGPNRGRNYEYTTTNRGPTWNWEPPRLKECLKIASLG